MPAERDAREFYPATDRNRDPILAILRELLAIPGTVLEIGSGSGQHAWYFAKHLPHVRWQPSDAEPERFASIEAWQAHEPFDNLLPPIGIDAAREHWPVDAVDAMFCANVIHIAPWSVTMGLLRGAGKHLRPGGQLITYGPYRIDGRHTAPSNESFDVDLRRRNPDWGVRDLEAVVAEALSRGLRFVKRYAMPANNFVMLFQLPPVSGGSM